MRSVFFHLTGVTRQTVAARLSALATQVVGPERWNFGFHSPEPALYVYFYDDLSIEMEPDDWKGFEAALGGMPDVSLCADVSGRIPGDNEVRALAALVLTEFNGVAWDDYSTHCWTLSEIQSGVQVHGHTFFDYEGWYEEWRKRPVT
jgi:hypothetical protein